MSSGRFRNLELDSNGEDRTAADAAAGFDANVLHDADFYLDEARRFELADEPEAALRSYSAALGEDPQRLDAWLGQLWILYDLKEYPEIDLWARKALEYFPDNPALVAMRSLASLGQGRKQEARELNDAALGKKGESDSVWLARADILMGSSATAGNDCLVHAKRVAEQPPITALRAARICFRHKRYRQTLVTLHELTAKSPESAAAWHLLGMTQWRMGDMQRARESLAQAKELSPHHPEIGAHAREIDHNGVGILRHVLRRLFSR